MEKIVGKIRDILRKEGITGMDSINHCIVFIICRLLTEKLCIKAGIPKKFAFDNIMKNDNGNELGDQELYDIFYSRGGKRQNLIGCLINNLKFKNIKFKLEGVQNLKLIMKKLQKLDTIKLSVTYDIIGTIYEIHLKSGTSNSMRDLGQYYTHRLVIKYMIELCDIKMIDGEIEKIIDPTMGTGGFITMAIKHLNKKYKNIDWGKNKDNIIGFDIDDNVKNMALLNIFLEIGELCTNTLQKQDTLYNDLKFNNGDVLQKAKVILANEPMGIKNIIHSSCCDRIKNMKIKGTKAEPLFLQLFMEALDDGGRCAVIIPDGVLFNESNLHKKTRKHLIENFNLKKVIALTDKDFFLNTGVKTSILFFANDGTKTKEIEFCDILINTKEEIEEKVVIKVKYDKIVENNYSLFVNKYIVEKIEKIEGVEYMKLKDICTFQKKSKRSATFGKKKGKYNFYTSGSTIKKCDEVDYINECIIIGDGGCANIYIDSNFSCSDHNYILHNNNDLINLKYLKFYLEVNISLLQNGFKGSTIKNLSKSYVNDLTIPIPSINIQNKIVERLDLLSENNKTLKENINEFKTIMKYYIEEHTDSCDMKKFGDICNMKSGKYNSKDCNKTGKYPFYNSKASNPSGFIDKFCFDYNKYLILIKDGGAGFQKYGEQIGLGKVFKVSGKTGATSHQLAIVIKNKVLSYQYLYYYMTVVKNNIMDLAQYTTGLGTIRKSNLEEFLIPIPSKEKQTEIVEYCDNLNNMIDNMEKQITNNKTLMKTILNSNINRQKLDDNSKVKSKTTSEKKSTKTSTKHKTVKDNKVIKSKKKTKVIKKRLTPDEEVDGYIAEAMEDYDSDNESFLFKKKKNSIKKKKIVKKKQDKNA